MHKTFQRSLGKRAKIGIGLEQTIPAIDASFFQKKTCIDGESVASDLPATHCVRWVIKTYPHERSEWMEGLMQEFQELCSVATHAGLEGCNNADAIQ